MINFLAKILGYVMQGCYWLTDNYVVSLMLFALAMQILLLPFAIGQQKNMVKQSKLRPMEMAIRKKYAGRNDKQTMQKAQTEIQELYQKQGYSQLAGCLPMLLQLILIFPIYQIVIRPLEFICGMSADNCGWLYATLCGDGKPPITYQIDVIRALAGGKTVPADMQWVVNQVKIDSVSLFGFDLGALPKEAFSDFSGLWFLILIPILNLGLMYVSQFLTKKFSYQNTQAEQMNSSSMKIMMYVMPLMTFFITFSFPAAIGLYWIFRTILSVIQQFLLFKTMPYPQYTEEEYKQAEKEYKKGKTTTATVSYPPREYKSLHHIDD